jgi:hypothetical protein
VPRAYELLNPALKRALNTRAKTLTDILQRRRNQEIGIMMDSRFAENKNPATQNWKIKWLWITIIRNANQKCLALGVNVVT